HRITKVLDPCQVGRLSSDHAKEIIATLEYMNDHPAAFAQELGSYTAVLKSESFPEEFRDRLHRIEEAVAARRKEKTPPPGNQPVTRHNTTPIPDVATACVRRPATRPR